MTRGGGEFYVGYESRSPRGIGRHTRVAIAALLALALGVALVLATGQRSFDAGVFEFGIDREFVGRLVEHPYPSLLVSDGEDAGPHLLVGPGKHGANELVGGLDARTVRVVGSAIHQGARRMIEAHSVESLGAAEPVVVREHSLGSMTLVGEIVDSKCYLGVMKPGRGKTHKACAVRCISGGSPPVLRVEDETGRVELFLLVSPEGAGVNDEVLDLVAEPIEITGTVIRRDGLLVLYADPADYRRTGS